MPAPRNILPTPTDAGPPRAGGPQPVQVVSAPCACRGKGWYWAAIPPTDVNWFHFAYRIAAPFPIVVGGDIDLMPPADPTPFPVGSGLVYLITDYQYHAWRTDPGGQPVPLGRNDLFGFVGFRLLVDSAEAPRMQLFQSSVAAASRVSSFPFLETRPGPQLQSVGFSVVTPVLADQRVRAVANFFVAPFITVNFLGFEFSGLRMAQTTYDRLIGNI